MRKRSVDKLEGPRPAGIKDEGFLVVYRLGHKRVDFRLMGSANVACKMQSVLIRREDEHEPPFDALTCEACGQGMILSESFRASGEVSHGVLRYRVLEERDGKEQPVGPWQYLPVGAIR